MHRQLTGKVVIATHNAGKLRELRELLAPFGVEAVSAGELGLAESRPRPGTCLPKTPQSRRMPPRRRRGLPALSDDSGICIDALDGAPGLFTADWAGPERDFSIAMARVERGIAQARHRRSR